MKLNSGYILEEMLKFYATKNIPRAMKKLANELGWHERSIRRMLYYNQYSKELLIETAVYLNLDPAQIFIK